jgi:hypothetical protein
MSKFMTPKWSGEQRADKRRPPIIATVAIILALILVIVALGIAKKYSAGAGTTPEAPLLKQK